MAAQQQQQQQQLFAAQLNQATLQAAHLQAQIQAQARAVSLQNLQQAAQMQSSAQTAATASMAGISVTMDGVDGAGQIPVNGEQATIDQSAVYVGEPMSSYTEGIGVTSSESDVVVTAGGVGQTGADIDHYADLSYINAVKQAPRIIYSSPPVIDSL